MDNECKYLKIEDVTPQHRDAFDHSQYQCMCRFNWKEKVNGKLFDA